MFLSLLWKEWVEQRWRMAFGAVVVGSLTMVGLHARMLPDEQVMALCAIIGAMLAMLVGMGVVAPERESGTLRTLLFLPIRPSLVLLAKGLIAAAVCLVPLAVSLTIGLLIAGGREMAMSRMVGFDGLAMLLSLTLLVWTVSLSMRAGSESIAGLVVVGMIAASCLSMTLCPTLGLPEQTCALWQPFALIDVAGGMGDDRSQSLPLSLFPIQGTLAAVLILFALWQFPRFGRRSR